MPLFHTIRPSNMWSNKQSFPDENSFQKAAIIPDVPPGFFPSGRRSLPSNEDGSLGQTALTADDVVADRRVFIRIERGLHEKRLCLLSVHSLICCSSSVRYWGRKTISPGLGK